MRGPVQYALEKRRGFTFGLLTGFSLSWIVQDDITPIRNIDGVSWIVRDVLARERDINTSTGRVCARTGFTLFVQRKQDILTCTGRVWAAAGYRFYHRTTGLYRISYETAGKPRGMPWKKMSVMDHIEVARTQLAFFSRRFFDITAELSFFRSITHTHNSTVHTMFRNSLHRCARYYIRDIYRITYISNYRVFVPLYQCMCM